MANHRTTTIFIGAGALLIAAMGAFWATSNTTEPPPPVPVPEPTPTPLTNNLTPVGKATAGTKLMLSSKLNRPYLLQGAGEGEVMLQVDVDAADLKGAVQSVPLDVAVVIDCSSSMSGQKMADARIAAQDFIMRLRDGDRVTVVPYSTAARVEVPMTVISDTAKPSIQRAIGALNPSGATNISEALSLARRTLDAQNNGANRVRRILLLSDGVATAGNTDPEHLATLAGDSRAGGVTLSTLGLGEDYNELVMTRIANKGGGNYYFISNSTQLAATFTKEFATLQTAIARDTVVTVQLAPGVRVQRLYGFEYNVTQDNRVVVPLGDFWAKRNASMLLKLTVDRSTTRLQQIGKVDLSYIDLLATSPQRINVFSALSTAITTDAALAEANSDPEVAVRYEQFLNIEAQENAMKRYEEGDVRGARSILNTRKAKLKKSQDAFKSSGRFDEKNAYMLDNLDKDYAQAEEAEKAVEQYGSGSSDGKKFLKSNRATNWSKGRSAR